MKSLIKFALLFLGALVIVALATSGLHAQDTTGVIPGTSASGIPSNWLTYIGYVLAVYEVLIKIIPTAGNYSILSNVFKFLNWLIHANNTK